MYAIRARSPFLPRVVAPKLSPSSYLVRYSSSCHVTHIHTTLQARGALLCPFLSSDTEHRGNRPACTHYRAKGSITTHTTPQHHYRYHHYYVPTVLSATAVTTHAPHHPWVLYVPTRIRVRAAQIRLTKTAALTPLLLLQGTTHSHLCKRLQNNFLGADSNSSTPSRLSSVRSALPSSPTPRLHHTTTSPCTTPQYHHDP